MKFVKGVMLGGLVTTGIFMLYAESGMMNKKTMMKKGKKLVKKMGIRYLDYPKIEIEENIKKVK